MIKGRIKMGLKTRRGVTSLYVVIFTTLLLGIITLSFIRIVISEVNQEGNSDLSQSAYDSAQAGIEDAKVALLRYHDCLSGRAVNDCGRIEQAMQRGVETDSCDVVRDVLLRPTSDNKEEVVIKETNNSTSESLLQAYTCVKISEELPDYRTTLSTNFRSRIIPLRTNSQDTNTEAASRNNIKNLKKIVVKWYSNVNGSASSLNFMPNSGSRFIYQPTTTPAYTPPVISVQLIQAGQSFVPNDDFNVPAGSNTTNRAEAWLYPVSGGGTNSISSDQFTKTATKVQDDSGEGFNANREWKITCNGFSQGKEFACETEIYLPEPINPPRSDNATFLRVELPYGTPTTDVSVELYNSGGQQMDFEGVQAQIDSTGRANDLYRRIETRVELVDIYYPYPEFVIQLDGGSNASISKDFYSTQNCWSSDNGDVDECPQNTQYAR